MKNTCKITVEKENKRSFIVALLPVPDFPDNKPCKDIVRQPCQAVVAANDDSGKWGFIALTGDEKHCIGDELNKQAVPNGEWRYCELYES